MARRITQPPTTMPKQRDVAERAGVSTATVSHVLSGQSDRVSDATRARVLAAIRDLGYKAPPKDTRGSDRLTRNIGVLAHELTDPPISSSFYFGKLIEGILSASLLKGWAATIMADRIWDGQGQSIRSRYDGRVDGMLLIAPEESDIARGFVERGIPVVQLGTPTEDPLVSFIDVDNYSIGRLAAEHLHVNGHVRVGYIWNTLATAAQERRDGHGGRTGEPG